LATVKGFRKGAVPKDLVAKQYGPEIKKEEIKKVVDLALERYLTSERLNLLGTPIAIVKEIFNWEQENLTFQFEIGLAPFFAVDLEANNEVIKYKIVADETLVSEQITRIQKQYGTLSPADIIAIDSEISATFVNETAGINKKTQFELSIFKDQTTASLFLGKKVGDVVTVNTLGLFTDNHKLMDVFEVNHDIVHTLAVDLTVTIETIDAVNQAELNQELFDKLFGEGKVASLDELKSKIKEDAEVQFAQSAEQKLTDDVIGSLIQNTKFDLPKDFLIKWLQTAGEKDLTIEQATAEYNRTENGLRFQMIEGRAMAQSNIKITFEDLKTFTSKNIRQQMVQFGQANATDAEVEGIVARVLSNKEEVKRLSEQVTKDKLMQSLIEKANPTEKQVTYQEFVKEMYGE
ncbi:MAG: trigger factor, partial [Flavobacterium sp.]|nr:trigger factor [Flavobacterium sp.]